MRNLKRALSLVLAVVMVIGLMVVGAGAVSYNDFSDREEIVNKDAVSMLTTLGIIEGQPDGSYNPTGDVDRAQMAKMISVALTNNEDCDTLYQNVNSGLTDISADWARGYINYCYVRGIIAGRGDNTFDPSANVTGVEAAKMLLAALGYNAEIEGLVGPDWALNTAALAQQLGIFRNFTKDVSEPLSRDDAALLIYNALDVELIQEYRNGYAIAYDDHRTILSSVFGVIRVEGVVVGNEWAQLQGTESDASLREGRTNLENVVWYDSTTANTRVEEGIVVDGIVPFNVSTPVEYIGKAVTLYVEKTTILSNSTVIGVATNDDQNVVLTNASNEDTSSDYLKGTGVTADDDTEYYVNYGHVDSEADAIDLINAHTAYDGNDAKFDLNGIEVEVIDNDDDGTADYVLYLVETFSEVSRYSERNEELSFYTRYNSDGDLVNTATTVTRDLADVVYADSVSLGGVVTTDTLDLAAEDLILYVEYGGRTYVYLPEIVTGTMTQVDRDKSDELYITVDDADEYRQSYILDAASLADPDLTHFDINDARNEPGFDTAYDFILDSNGYVIAIRPAEETVTNCALVLESAWTQNALTRSGEVKILMADGTENTFDIDWNESRKVFENETTNTRKDTALENYLGTRDVQHSGSYRTGAAVGTVIEYSLNDAGDELTIENILNLSTLEGTENPATTAQEAGYVDQNSGDPLVDVVGNPIAYIAANRAAADANVRTDDNLQYTVGWASDSSTSNDDYSTGDGTLYLTVKSTDAVSGARNQTVSYAIDRDTIAFYYVDSDTYGVATGYSNMSDVATGVSAQVYPVLEKNNQGGWTASRLADVVLFNSEPTNDSNDYMLVLNANHIRGDELWLNVVFEDGTAATIEIDDDGGHDFDRTSSYMKAYAYVENADGTYDISDRDPIGAYNAHRTDNGTVYWGAPDSVSAYDYLTVLDSSNVWDVTDVDSANDDITTGTFTRTDRNAVIITGGSRNETIRAAWVWDIDDTTVDFDTSDYRVVLTTTAGASGNYATIRFNVDTVDTPTEDEALALVEAKLTDEGYTVTDRTINDDGEYLFSVRDRNGFSRTFRFDYDISNLTVDSAWIVSCYVGRINGVEEFIATGSANITSSLTNGDSYYGRVSGTADYEYGLISSGFTVTGSGFDVEDGYYAVDLSGLSFTDDTDPTVGANLRIEVTVNGDDLVDLDNYVSTTQTLYLEGDDNEITATVTGALSATASGTSWIGATQNYGLVRDIVDWVADQDDADVELSTGARTNRINFVGGVAATNFNGIEVTFTWTLDHTDTGAALNLNAGNT